MVKRFVVYDLRFVIAIDFIQSDGKKPAKRGPLSKIARDECLAFGKRVAAEATELARKFEKSKAVIMMTAGLKLRETRDKNLYCKFRKWYAREHPIAPGGEDCRFRARSILTQRSRFRRFQRRDGRSLS